MVARNVTMGSEEVQARLWSADPAGWAVQAQHHYPLFRAMITATAIDANKNVLDIGCGTGHSSDLIARSGATVIGVDIAKDMVDYARSSFPRIDFQIGSIENLAFGDNEFDVVYAANSVQYAADLNIALQELKRVCKPSGLIVAGLFGPPDRVAYKPVLEALGPFMPEPPPGARPGGPFRLSTPGALEEAFTSADIVVLAKGEANCPFTYSGWDDFWRATRAAGPTQMAMSRVGIEAVEKANRDAVERLIAEDGSITFDPNVFIFVVGRA